jgi:hypothetical protein
VIALLDPALPRAVEHLREQFRTAQPFRHVVIDRFLDAAFCRQLMAEFPVFDQTRAINERGEPGRKAVVPRLAGIGAAYARFDRLMRDREFLSLVGRVTGIPGLLYDPDYVGGGTHENLDGQDLDPHVDFNFHPTRALHRRLNLIVFLNARWDPAWGGCLELLRDPWSRSPESRRIVVPLENRAVIFETTECSWHGFERIRLPESERISRRSIAVYFYSRSRPPRQTTAAHGTIYYQRPLPERVRAGYTLQEEDVAEMQALLDRRDRQIRFLYERELQFSSAIGGITASASFRLGRLLTWPARALRSLRKTH